MNQLSNFWQYFLNESEMHFKDAKDVSTVKRKTMIHNYALEVLRIECVEIQRLRGDVNYNAIQDNRRRFKSNCECPSFKYSYAQYLKAMTLLNMRGKYVNLLKQVEKTHIQELEILKKDFCLIRQKKDFAIASHKRGVPKYLISHALQCTDQHISKLIR